MPARKASRPALPGAIELRFRQVRQELHQLDYFLKGTVLKRMMKCGQPQCACHRDPARRHGPYFEWTYKGQGQDGQREAQPASRPALSGRYQTAPETQRRSGQDGAPLANRLSSPGEGGGEYRLNGGDMIAPQTVSPPPVPPCRLSRLLSATCP
jgi:hypothetical protein